MRNKSKLDIAPRLACLFEIPRMWEAKSNDYKNMAASLNLELGAKLENPFYLCLRFF